MYAAIHSIAHDCHHHLVDSVLYEVMVIILIVKNSARLFQGRTSQTGSFFPRVQTLQQNSSAKFFVLNGKLCILI